MIALENRFYYAPDGNIYSNNIFDYSIWKKYLQVFDRVFIYARLGETNEVPDKPCSSGENIEFFGLPMYIGPIQYWKVRKGLVKRAIEAADGQFAYILRIPGNISSTLWQQLIKRRKPYGVEVVGSHYDAIETCGIKFPLKPIIQYVGDRKQILQCSSAAAAAYVSQYKLQKKYVPGGWTTYYSSIDLYDDAIIDDAALSERLDKVKSCFRKERPFRVCHAGSMAAMYKGQDVLLEAVGIAITKGYDFEVVLMGDGKYRPYFQQKSEELGLSSRVQFLGNVSPGGHVREQYDAADILVFPSYTEGLPRVIVEAMARGLPVVGSNVGAIPELLSEEYLCPPGDPHTLADTISKALNNQEHYATQARRNLEKAQEFRHAELTKRRNNFYRQVEKISEEYYRLRV